MCLKPSRISYNVTISACARGGAWQLALALLGRMVQGRLATLVSGNAAMTAAAASGAWQAGCQGEA